MADNFGWIEKISRSMLSWFSRKEVKTPLSFYFRAVAAISVILIVAMVVARADVKFFFIWGIGAIAGVSLLVGLFAWFKPKNLVYGETGHRAESKLDFGTEKRQIAERDLQSLPGTPNPEQPASQALTERL